MWLKPFAIAELEPFVGSCHPEAGLSGASHPEAGPSHAEAGLSTPFHPEATGKPRVTGKIGWGPAGSPLELEPL